MSLTFTQLQSRLSKSIQRDDLASSYPEFINEALREVQNRRSFTCMKASTFVSVLPGVLTAGGTLIPPGSIYGAGPGSVVAIFAFNVTIGGQYFFKTSQDSLVMTAPTDGTAVATNGQYFTATQATYYIVANETMIGTSVEGQVYAPGLYQVATLPENFKELQKLPAVDYVADDGGFIPAELVYEAQQIFRIWAFGGTPMMTWPPRVFYEKRGNSSVIGLVEPLSQIMNFRVKYYGYLPDLSDGGDISPLAALYPKLVLAKAKAIAFTEINDDVAAETAEQEFEKKLGEAIRQDAYSEVAGRSLHL